MIFMGNNRRTVPPNATHATYPPPVGSHHLVLRVPAKVEYALRALVALARLAPNTVKGDRLARDEDIPFRFLELTLGELRHAGIVASRRGSDGGYWLGRDADQISVADVMIALEGTLIDVRIAAAGSASATSHQQTARLWDRSEQQLQALYSSVTIADLAAPETADPGTADPLTTDRRTTRSGREDPVADRRAD